MDGMSCSLWMFLLFNKEIIKFHVPNLDLKTKKENYSNNNIFRYGGWRIISIFHVVFNIFNIQLRTNYLN